MTFLTFFSESAARFSFNRRDRIVVASCILFKTCHVLLRCSDKMDSRDMMSVNVDYSIYMLIINAYVSNAYPSYCIFIRDQQVCIHYDEAMGQWGKTMYNIARLCDQHHPRRADSRGHRQGYKRIPDSLQYITSFSGRQTPSIMARHDLLMTANYSKPSPVHYVTPSPPQRNKSVSLHFSTKKTPRNPPSFVIKKKPTQSLL